MGSERAGEAFLDLLDELLVLVCGDPPRLATRGLPSADRALGKAGVSG
jgi:hypothetical protein